MEKLTLLFVLILVALVALSPPKTSAMNASQTLEQITSTTPDLSPPPAAVSIRADQRIETAPDLSPPPAIISSNVENVANMTQTNNVVEMAKNEMANNPACTDRYNAVGSAETKFVNVTGNARCANEAWTNADLRRI